MTDGVETPGISEETAKLAELGRTGGAPAVDPLAPKLSETPRPEHIPEKFWDPIAGAPRVEEMAKSYAELEKLVGGKKDEPKADEEKPEEKPEEGKDPADDKDPGDKGEVDKDEDAGEPSAALKSAIENAQAVYAETGELDADSRKALADAGIGEAQLDIYLAGVSALEKALEASAHEAAGGAEQYQAAVQWAAENWSPKEIAAYDAQMGDPALVKNAVKGLMASYREAEPGEGKLHSINTGSNHGDVYQDIREFHADLAKANETRDALARSQAVQKLQRSRKAGTVQSNRRQPFGG